MTLVIADTHDLDRTAQMARWSARPDIATVYVNLPWLDSVERVRAARAVAAYLNEFGGLWSGPAFLSVLAWGAVGAPWSTLGSGASLSASMGLAVAAAVIAKAGAVAWSRWRLQVLLQRLARGGVIGQRGH